MPLRSPCEANRSNSCQRHRWALRRWSCFSRPHQYITNQHMSNTWVTHDMHENIWKQLFVITCNLKKHNQNGTSLVSWHGLGSNIWCSYELESTCAKYWLPIQVSIRAKIVWSVKYCQDRGKIHSFHRWSQADALSILNVSCNVCCNDLHCVMHCFKIYRYRRIRA